MGDTPGDLPGSCQLWLQKKRHGRATLMLSSPQCAVRSTRVRRVANTGSQGMAQGSNTQAMQIAEMRCRINQCLENGMYNGISIFFSLAHAFQNPTLFIRLELNTQPNHSNKSYRRWVNGNAIFVFILKIITASQSGMARASLSV